MIKWKKACLKSDIIEYREVNRKSSLVVVNRIFNPSKINVFGEWVTTLEGEKWAELDTDVIVRGNSGDCYPVAKSDFWKKHNVIK